MGSLGAQETQGHTGNPHFHQGALLTWSLISMASCHLRRCLQPSSG